MDKILIGLTIAVILYPIVSGALIVKEFRNIGNRYWKRRAEDEDTKS